MLKVFCGNDVIGVRESASTYLTELRLEDDELDVGRLEAENYEPGKLASLSETMPLFGGSKVYVVDMPSTMADFWNEVLAEIETMERSQHTFILIEGNILAADKKKISKFVPDITEYKKTAEQNFDAFKMAEALARKDKKLLWLLLQESIVSGMSAEEIIGILWWQLKTLRLATLTNLATEAGVKDYPYNKAKRSLSNFKAGEVGVLSLSLLELYHDGHLGKRDITLALEEWVLRM
ncbi:MAG: hypothetical protein R3B53_00755 [Candidatus Paceibacterota bacterium]